MGFLGGSGRDAIDFELRLYYEGKPAHLTPLDHDIVLMKYMGWNEEDLRKTSNRTIRRIDMHMRADAEGAQKQSKK